MGDTRNFLLQALAFVSVFAAVLAFYQTLRVVTLVEAPISVVISGSMEPAFARGDVIIVMDEPERPMQSGDIVVYRVPNKLPDIPVVHRVHSVHISESGEELLLTKGDNNPVHDRIMLSKGQLWVERQHVEGRVFLYLPYIGYLSIMLQQTWARYAAVFGLFIMTIG